MAEITKVTTPMIPRENIGSRNRPVSEQTFELNNPQKVNKPHQDKNIWDREAGGQSLRDNLGRAAMQPLLRDSGELMYNIRKMVTLLQLGISTSDVVQDPDVREMMQKLFSTPEELLQQLRQQDESNLLFKGETFNVLRDILARFDQMPNIKDMLVQLLRTFEYNVNAQNSMKSILNNCANLLDYMFSKDREQFLSYLKGLAEMLLPKEEIPALLREIMQQATEQAQAGQQAQQGEQVQQGEQAEKGAQAQQQPGMQPMLDAQGKPVLDAQGNPVMQEAGQPEPVSQREAAQVLKSNLLPLLGEIVVKYNQNEHIRDIVMVVVHNIVRVDKGTPEMLREAVASLVYELKKSANLPENFEQSLLNALKAEANYAKAQRNDIMDRLATVLSQTLHNPSQSTPPELRQAENLLLSLLQNQSSMMEVLHFVLPTQTENDRLFAELYVDPDSDEGKGGKSGEKSRKLFLSVDSESHGQFEFSFLQTGDRVDFSLWCPKALTRSLSGMKRTLSDIMLVYGYTMTGFRVEELQRPQSVAQVFPRLLNRKVGIDVRV